jgi:UDP-N-acetylglucosamine:LPS N-acetylglucosamine transferase
MTRIPRVLAVSSGGGHWIELMRVMSAFEGCDVAFLTVNKEYRSEVEGHRFYVVNDATRWNKFALVLMAIRLLLVIVRERPDVIITTGAAPGYFALRFGRWFGARTIWLDSIANVEELSLSGQMAGRVADLWLTQWEHLATNRTPHATRSTHRSSRSTQHTTLRTHPEYAGAVL